MNSNTKETKHTAPEKHVRRKHYAGRYPKNFEEKYKELNPEKYQDIATHVKAKGSTPAGTHIPIMVREILDFLQIKPGQTGFDATLGYGHWDTEATPAPCWNSYKAKDTCMQQM